MKAISEGNGAFRKLAVTLARVLIIAGFLFGVLTEAGHAASIDPGTNTSATYKPLNSWSFNDTNNWTSDNGYAPVSFTNLAFSHLGNGASLIVDSTNAAWLNYNIYEPTNGATNLTLDVGSVMFWFAPGSWSSTNAGGNGPGEYGRLLEVGGYTDDSSYGLWSIYVDDGGNNLYFSAQTNDLSSNLTTYVSAPISWTTNYFHFIALTYSATNTVLYFDGALAASGPPVTVYPGPDVQGGGFYLGSDSNGVLQAHGLFNSVKTYNVALDADTIQSMYNTEYVMYEINPYNIRFMSSLASATTSATNGADADVITGPGYLQLISSGTAITSSNVWITNVVATETGSGTNRMTLEFTIQGGTDGVPYDVFANSVLSFGTNGVPWSWMGQGYHGNTYLLTNLPSTACYLILGTPLDSDGDGLTDAYENLVSKTDPNNPSTDGTGMSDGWEILYFGHTGIDTNADPDGDGLSNLQEYQMRSAGYNPTLWDSNGNGVSDGYEDYSGDGLANFMEPVFGLNFMNNNPAWKSDTDGDGLPDLYETMAGSGALGLPAYSKNPTQ